MIGPRGWRVAVVAFLTLAGSGCTVVGYPAGGVPTSSPAPPGARSDAGRRYEVFGEQYRVLDTAQGYDEVGVASWYGQNFHGRPTASGERYDMYAISAAHRTLPLHTWVEVVNLDNGRRLVLRVNDRGPFVDTSRRILDLSYGAAQELGVVAPGLARVQVRTLTPSELEQVAAR